MKRLTFEGNFCDIAQCRELPCKYPDTGCAQRQVWERLKAYEDTGLEPEDLKRTFAEDAIIRLAAQVFGVSVFRLRELAQADKEGRVVLLSAGVGDKLSGVDFCSGEIFVGEVVRQSYFRALDSDAEEGLIILDDEGFANVVVSPVMGRNLFETRKEAEAALERQKGERDG